MLPRNHGKAWHPVDIVELKAMYTIDGAAVTLCAEALGRTTISIKVQLSKQGLIDANGEVPEYYTPSFAKAVEPNQCNPNKEPSMTFNLTFEQRTLINGHDADKLSNNDLLNLLKQAEAELREIESFNNKPKILAQREVDLQQGIMKLVNLLDARSDAVSEVTSS